VRRASLELPQIPDGIQVSRTYAPRSGGPDWMVYRVLHAASGASVDVPEAEVEIRLNQMVFVAIMRGEMPAHDQMTHMAHVIACRLALTTLQTARTQGRYDGAR